MRSGWRTFVDEETKRLIQEALTRSPESIPVSEEEISSTKGDKQLLRLLERCCQDGFELPFPPKSPFQTNPLDDSVNHNI